jgi:hypothetical protein
MRRMVTFAVCWTGFGQITRVPVSLPLVPALVDGRKYMAPADVPHPEPLGRRKSRGPSLRRLVRLAMACDSAEQLGQQLKRRYDRSLQRQGMAPADRRRVEAEVAAQLDRLLVQD